MKNRKLRTTLAYVGLLVVPLVPTTAAAQELSDVKSNGPLHSETREASIFRETSLLRRLRLLASRILYSKVLQRSDVTRWIEMGLYMK